MLADYDFYKNTYFGKNALNDSQWNSYARLAETFLNQYTFSRIIGDDDKEKACMAICEIVDKLFENDNLPASKGITSESVDGHSVSFERRKTTNQLKPIIQEIIERNLFNSNLLYRGNL